MPEMQLGEYNYNTEHDQMPRPSDRIEYETQELVDIVSCSVHGLFDHLGLDAKGAKRVDIKPRIVQSSQKQADMVFFIELGDYKDGRDGYRLKAYPCRGEDEGPYLLFQPFEGSGMEEEIAVPMDPGVLAYEDSVGQFAMYRTQLSN